MLDAFYRLCNINNIKDSTPEILMSSEQTFIYHDDNGDKVTF